MANESFVAVPPNVEDPQVLRRFLSRLVEQVDVAFGNRAGSSSAYVDQQVLLDTAESLTESLASAKVLLEEASDALSVSFSELVEDYEERFTNIETALLVLNNATAFKSAMLSFTVDSLGDLVHGVKYNIDTGSSSKISTGVYEFSVNQATFYGLDVLANSTVSSEHVIAPGINSELFDVSIESTGTPGTFRVSISEFVVGTGSKLQIQPYDILPGDYVYVTAIFTNPSASLPPA